MSIGIWQLVLILVIVVLIFGAGKLPNVMGDVATGIKNFKKGLKDEELTDQSGEAKRPAESGAHESGSPQAVRDTEEDED